MPRAISNTSPLLYLHRIGAFKWFPSLFEDIWVPSAVVNELKEGKLRGHDVPNPSDYAWMSITDPHSIPSEWITSDLGLGELAAISLALENPNHIVLLDDDLARKVAQAAGLKVWGTLRVLLEAKEKGLTMSVRPHLERLIEAGMWISSDICQRILKLANESV
jgi:predicted nucleic acid-binding protein